MKLFHRLLGHLAKPAPPPSPCVRRSDLPTQQLPSPETFVKSPIGEVMVPIQHLMGGVDAPRYALESERDSSRIPVRPAGVSAGDWISPTGLAYQKCEPDQATTWVLPGEGLQANQPKIRSYDDLPGILKQCLGPEEYGRRRWESEFSRRQMEALLVLFSMWSDPSKSHDYSVKRGMAPRSSETVRAQQLTESDLRGVTVAGVHTDRKHFEVTFAMTPEAQQRLGSIIGGGPAKGLAGERGYLCDPAFPDFHPDYQGKGGRAQDSHFSLQFMLGEGVGAGDVDWFQPLKLPGETNRIRAFARHWLFHWGEIVVGKNLWPDYMHPEKVARRLQIPLFQEAV